MEKNKRVFVIIVLVLALVLGGAGLLYRQLSAGYTPEQLSLAAGEQVPAASSPAEGEGAEEAQSAPDFTVYDAEGKQYYDFTSGIGWQAHRPELLGQLVRPLPR